MKRILGYALITVKPEHREDYVNAFHRLREDVKSRDPGTIRYDLHQRQDDPCRFIVIEEYEDQAALDLHMANQPPRRWQEMVDNWMEKCEFYFCSPLNYDGKRVA